MASMAIGPLSSTALVPSVWLSTTTRSRPEPGTVTVSVRVVTGARRETSVTLALTPGRALARRSSQSTKRRWAALPVGRGSGGPLPR